MKAKRRVLWSVSVLALVAAAGVGYAVWRSRAKARVPTGVSARVTRENLDVIVRTQGLIVAATTIEVKSRASGYVQAIYASAGDRVRRDQVLLEVDPSRSRLNEDEARNEVEAARSQVRLSEESLDPERIALLRSRLDRQRELEQKGLIKREDVETSQYDLAAAERAFRSQQKQLEAARLRLETSMTRLRRAQTESSFTTIRAPIDGVVMTRAVEVGSGVTSFSDSVQGGSVLFKIGSLDRLAFEGSLAVSDLTRVKAGLPARITSDAWPAPATGAVMYVGQEAIPQAQTSSSGTQRAATFQVKIQLDPQTAKNLPLNVPAVADIVISTVPSALVVPYSCVRHLPNSQGTLREDKGGVIQDRSVKLGPVTAGKVQVTGEIQEGATIVGCGPINAVAIRP
jgi:HlyD family secretion protein